MSWEVKPEPNYQVDIWVENISLTIEYDTADPDGKVESISDVLIRRIWHREQDIKRIVRGFQRQLIAEIVFKKHYEV